MNIRKFEIALENTLHYSPGSNISGWILLWLNKPKRIRGVKIKITGKAFVSWDKKELVNKGKGKNNYRTVHYNGKETFLKEEYFLEGSDNCKITIAAGYEHVYPFFKVLPHQLPPSFEGQHGYIRYSIKARLVRPWMLDVKEKKQFTVITPLNLNLHPSARFPVNKCEEKTFFNHLNLTEGSVKLIVNLLQSGYVAGQDIPISVNVINNSNVMIDSVELKLIKSEYWAVTVPQPDHKIYKTELVKKILNGVEANGSKSFSEILNVGHPLYINLHDCRIIKISFYIKVKACVHSLGHKGLSSKIPIFIGTVPICQKFSSLEMINSNTLPRNNIFEINRTSSSNEGIYIPNNGADPPPYSEAISNLPSQANNYALSPQQYGATALTNLEFNFPRSSYPDSNSFRNLSSSSVNTTSHIYPSAPSLATLYPED